MTEQILLPPVEARPRKFWKPWKWIGLISLATVVLLGRWLPQLLVALGFLYGMVVLANLVFFAFRFLKDRFFWRVRNRIISSMIFGGALPLLILVGIVSLSVYLLFAQLANHYLNSSLQENAHQISEISLELGRRISSGDPAKAFPVKAAAVLAEYAARFPRLSARLSKKNAAGNLEVILAYDPQDTLPDASPYPGSKWLNGSTSFEGVLAYREKLFLSGLQPIPGSPDFYLEITAPVDNFLEDRLRQEKSLYVVFINPGDANVFANGNRVQITIPDGKAKNPGEKASANRITKRFSELSPFLKMDTRKKVSSFMPVRCKAYKTGEVSYGGIASVWVPWKVILDTYLDPDNVYNRALLYIIFILAGLFLVVTIISLIIGLMISRHVTRSVHDMYQGILALQKGNLQHQIPVRRKDQLGLMAYSFNQMSASIARLLDEVVEKKRLEQELKIAHEVQATLFPKQLPHPPGMSVFGGCKPARVVSGDYYDFIVETETRLDIVVGDISGKGISAALLMANLQAAMRNQLLAGYHGDRTSSGQNLAEVMAHLNRQIYLNSPPEKYATLFLSRYDASSHRLWYCNAGHLPPIVLTAQGMQTLDATGMVIGLFPDATYEAKCVDLIPGTMLAIFTDGITEALNKADEEFGDQNLRTALQQASMRPPEDVWEYVMSQVDAWQSGLPQYDDITLIVAKAG